MKSACRKDDRRGSARTVSPSVFTIHAFSDILSSALQRVRAAFLLVRAVLLMQESEKLRDAVPEISQELEALTLVQREGAANYDPHHKTSESSRSNGAASGGAVAATDTPCSSEAPERDRDWGR